MLFGQYQSRRKNRKRTDATDFYLFQDTERSHIYRIREQIEDKPVRLSLIYGIFMLVWVVMLTLGHTIEHSGDALTDLYPHVAGVAVVLGVFIYPRRYIWIPIVTFALVYAVTPFVAMRGYAIAGETSEFIALLWIGLGANLLVSILLGMCARALHVMLHRAFEPFMLDLVLSITSGPVFALFLCLMVPVFINTALIHSPNAAQSIGLDAGYTFEAFVKSAYGGITIMGLLIGILRIPREEHVVRALPYAALFPLLAILGNNGFRLDETWDALALCGLLAILLPFALVIPTLTVGLMFYIGMTGAVIEIEPPESHAELVLEIYSLGAFFIIMLLLAIRSHDHYRREKQMGSIRRLNTVRNNAGVGVFSIDLQNRLVSIDPVTQRMLNLGSEIDLTSMMRQFPPEQQEELRDMMFGNGADSKTLLARLKDSPTSSLSRTLRLFLWNERGQRNERSILGLVVDVTGEHLQEKALRETMAELSSNNDKQKQLFSIISHELRTPASIISMLIDDMDEPQVDYDRLHARLRESTDQLLGVLTDMRQAVNPEKNLPVNLVPFVPFELAESIKNTFEMQAEAAEVLIRLRLGDGANELCMGDNVRIKQILGNLIRNAIIHSQCTTITISYRSAYNVEDSSRIGVWSISDDGVGIPPDQVERLFQPFQRGTGDDPRNRPDGSGLGLYIVKSSAHVLGGHVEYFPAPEGGAGYHIRLPEPLADGTLLPDADDPDADDLDFASLRVLLAEDNALVAEVTSARLRKYMGSVVHAPTGRRALELIHQDPPDVLITDLYMPEMNGAELIRTLREEGNDLPIIGLTAAVVGDDMRQFEMVGASHIMTKPLEDAQLMRFLRSEFARRKRAAAEAEAAAMAQAEADE
ncbi:hybrid sensor histidine kinase/response regulator [Marivivens aquimaris]|uniref:hybrid sensor histidine kinase/response regulator n=1 Tax=Marivivens aquimaris TaxID=2774876 RepID=UPI001880E4F6|nr:ATP-binding protein [Marivivens aquimaris]